MTQREVFWEDPIQGNPLDPLVYASSAGVGFVYLQGVFGELTRVVTGSQERNILHLVADGTAITDGEVAIQILPFTSNGAGPGPAVRSNNAAPGALSAYIAGMNGGSPHLFSIQKYVGGTLTSLATANNTIGATPAAGVNCRLKVEGTALKARFWAIGTPEPSGWTVETTDTSLASGSFGIFSVNVGTYRYGKLSIGYGGDVAPPLEYRIAGQVTDYESNPLARVVRAHERASGRVQGETISDAGTGSFEIMVKKVTALHYVVALDDLGGEKNAIVKDRILPYAG